MSNLCENKTMEIPTYSIMSHTGWLSKRDIVKDLAKASGKYYVRDLDRHVLVGEQPPPPHHMTDTDVEIQLLRLYGGCKPSTNEVIEDSTPDLAGITQMLRMVDRLTEKPAEEEPAPRTNDMHVLSISKLNPNVQEFIPKKNDSLSSIDDSNRDKTDDNCDIVSSLSGSRIGITQRTSDEIKDMREKLKAKISDTSKAACVRIKRERNLAIATLLKLYCQTPKSAPPADPQPKLISPDYFEQCPTEKIDNNPKSIETTADENIAASVDKVKEWLRNSQNAEDSSCAATNVEVNDVHRERNALSSSERSNSEKESTHQLQKNSPLYLGTVTFKRKASSKPMSPTSTDSAERRKAQKSSNFVPSLYANELIKTYTERNKVKEALELDLWTKLERELKAKDEEIKKRQAAQEQEQTSSQSNE